MSLTKVPPKLVPIFTNPFPNCITRFPVIESSGNSELEKKVGDKFNQNERKFCPLNPFLNWVKIQGIIHSEVDVSRRV